MALIVNEERIEDAALREERKAIRRALSERMPEENEAALDLRAREWARENLIERVLLNQAALREGSSIDVLIAKLSARADRPRAKDIADHYKKNATAYQVPEAVHAAHIVKNIDEQSTEESAKSAMDQIMAALQNGESFGALADKHSDCPGQSGDLGYFGKGQMVEEFEAVAFTLPIGQTSEVIRTPFGYHIVKVYDRRASGVLPLDEVRATIEEQLVAENKQKAVERYIDTLRAKAKVQEV